MRRKSAREAHNFEREAEADAFLYEAMEGFEDVLTSDLQQAMDELDDRLDEKLRTRNPMIWWRIAAGVVLVIGLGTAIRFLMMSESDEAPVEQEIADEQNYKPRNAAFGADTLEMIPEGAWASSDSVHDDIVEEEVYSEPAIAVVETPQPEVVEQYFANDDEVAATGNTLQEMDDVAFEDTPADEKLEIDAMSAEEPEESEIAAVESAPAQNRSLNTAKSAAMSESNATPKGGFASYNNYLRQNLKKSNSMPTGSVVLSFEFDRSGKPKNIRVTQSLCTACDAEAIRLVSTGPKWEVKDRKQRTTLSVRFP